MPGNAPQKYLAVCELVSSSMPNVKDAWSDNIKIFKNESHYFDFTIDIKLRYWCTHLLISVGVEEFCCCCFHTTTG